MDTQQALQTIDWLRLNSSQTPMTAAKNSTPLDELCAVMSDRLSFDRHERDMICLHHIFGAEFDGGRRREVHTSTLVAYGDGNYSAMAKTVSLPAAIGADLILQGIYHMSDSLSVF